MRQKLFTLGPVEMYDYTRERLSEQLPYFRTEGFSKINLECAERLKRLAGAPEESHVYLLTCSGTGAMEAVVGGCFDNRDELLVIDGGGFGNRFVDMSVFHGIPCAAVTLEFEETLNAGMLEKAGAGPDRESGAGPGAGFTGMLVNLHETATGQLYDMNILSSFCKNHDLYFVCDAIGSFLADPLDFEKDGIDALIISSQKALALPPGLSIVILSDRLFKKIGRQGIKPFSQYFDFTEAEKNAKRGQTPYTPAIGEILALRDRLEKLEAEGGAEAAVSNTKKLAEDFRERISPLIEKGWLALPDHPLSNACTPLIFPNGGAGEVFKKLYENGIWVNPNGGALADKVLRVGHLGNLSKEDIGALAMLLAEIVSAKS